MSDSQLTGKEQQEKLQTEQAMLDRLGIHRNPEDTSESQSLGMPQRSVSEAQLRRQFLLKGGCEEEDERSSQVERSALSTCTQPLPPGVSVCVDQFERLVLGLGLTSMCQLRGCFLAAL